jgi:hypothetical protein
MQGGMDRPLQLIVSSQDRSARGDEYYLMTFEGRSAGLLQRMMADGVKNGEAVQYHGSKSPRCQVRP